MTFKSVILAVAAVLASSAFADGASGSDCLGAKGPVDWVDPTIGATSHMLVPTRWASLETKTAEG